MELLTKGFELMGMGLVGVFAVLIFFYFMIKVLIKVFPPKEGEK